MPNQRLLNYFYFLLARRDYTENQLKTKAIQKQYPLNDIITIIDELKSQKLVDDTRFVENFIHSYGSSKGHNWLKSKLLQKGVSFKLIEKLLLAQPEKTDIEHLRNLIFGKYKISDIGAIDFKLKSKMAAFLARRGYTRPFDILEQILNKD